MKVSKKENVTALLFFRKTQKGSSFLVDKLTLNVNVKVGMCGINKTDKHAGIVISIIGNTFDFSHKLMIDHSI